LATFCGLITALAAARLVQSMLFVISAHDGATFVLVPAILALVAVIRLLDSGAACHADRVLGGPAQRVKLVRGGLPPRRFY
jgi:hypothetical protein